MTSICLHCFISGRVQGVFYRHNTYKEATERGITGWVRNLEDGRVEVLLCGEEQVLKDMQEWLWRGPTNAQVTAVDVEEVPFQKYKDFLIKD